MYFKTSFLTCIIFLLAVNVFAQVQENFNDGDFINNPAWVGDTAKWQVINGNLNSKSQILNDTFYLSTASASALDAEWRIYMELNFQTSSNNLIDIYLISNQQNLKSSLNGYFVRIGDTKDDISLYRRDGNTIAKLIDGMDGRSQVGSATKISLKVTRTSAGLFSLSDDNAGGSNYFSEGTVTDATYSSSSFFGIAVRQSTASFFGKHFFDDIYAGPIIIDNTPPSIASVTVIPPNQLDVLFSEAVGAVSSQKIENYSVNGGISTASSAVKDGSNASLVHLTFSNNFQSGTNYILSVDSIRDLSGNLLVHATSNFSFYQPQKGDVQINEIMADPDPVVGLPSVEYVELYNASQFAIDLTGWIFADASTQQTLSAVTLQPDSFLILCSSANKNLFTGYGKVLGLSSLPSLNNDKDSLKLKDGTGKIISSVNYSDSWYQDDIKKAGGWSLELIDPLNPCKKNNNWIASNDPSGGTPGRKNSVFNSVPDITPPAIVSAVAIDDMTVQLIFSEPLDSAIATDVSHYSINLGIETPIAASIDAATLSIVTLQLGTTIQSKTLYEITVDTISDCPGNILLHATANFSLYLPQKYDVLINEIMPDPDPVISLPSAEYVELYNASSFAINLTGWTFSDASTQQIFSAVTLQPDSFLILCASANAGLFTGYGKVLGLISLPSLNNDTDSLKLKDASGKIISAVNYSDAWYGSTAKKEGGWSLELVDPKNPCGGANNWKASIDPSGGTPGRKNSVFGSNPDTETPKVLRALILNDTIVQVYFNEPMDSILIANQSHYSIDNGINTPAMVFADASLTKVTLTLSASIKPKTIYTVTVSQVSDCSGNLISSANFAYFAIPEALDSNDIIINEVLFNPISSGYDYLEIYNRSQKILDLKELFVANRNDSSQLANIKSVSAGYLFFPGDYVVLTQNPDWVKQNYAVQNPENFIHLSSLPSMNDDKGNIALLKSGQKIIDELRYTKGWQFPLIDDQNGVALERIYFDSPTQDSSNWHSAASSVGYGTPTYRNSQYRDASQTSDEISIDPQVFSPDQDGYNDVAVIRYSFNQPGYVANIRIYDKEGRLVRDLVKNELLEQSGFFTWDGTADDYSRPRIGIYIVYTEVFDLSGAVKKIKKTCVLAGKQR